MARIRLIIPYVSQLVPKTETDFAQGDCGPSCLAALARAKTGRHISVDEISRMIRPGGNFFATSVSELAKFAPQFGVTLKVASRVTKTQLEQQLNARHSVILLIYYPALPRALKYDPRYSYNHFITVHGMDGDLFYYDDPFWPDKRGENKAIAKDSLIYAANRVVEATPGLSLFTTNVTLPLATTKPKDGGTLPVPTGFTLDGTILNVAGRPIAGAGIQLMAKRDLLVHVPGADVAPQRGSVSWSKIRNTIDETRWNYFEQNVQGKLGLSWTEFNTELLRLNPSLTQTQKFVAGTEYKLPELAHGISWTRPIIPDRPMTRDEAFVQYVAPDVIGQLRTDFYTEVVSYNPSLKAQGAAPVLQPNVTYRFPENVWGVDVEWSRKVSGLRIPVNNRSGLFTSEIQGKVLGLTHNQFIEEFTRLNPIVTQDGGLILPEREYTLPVNVPAEICFLSAWTGADGNYKFTSLKEGRYIITVEGAGHEAYSDTLFMGANKTASITLAVRATEGRGRDTGLDEVIAAHQITELPAFIQTKGSRLTIAGQSFRFVGVNLPGILHYGMGKDVAFKKTTSDTRLVQMTAARENGASVIRVRLAHRNATAHDVIARLEVTLAAATHLGLQVIATFVDGFDERNFYVKGDGTYYRDGTKTQGDKLSAGFFTKCYLKNYLPFVQSIVRRFRDHPAILAWELGNAFMPPDGEAFIGFAHAVAEAIHDYDPFHLILPGIAGVREAGLTEEQGYRLYNHRTIHAVTTASIDGEVSQADLTLAQLLNRPLMVTSGGVTMAGQAIASATAPIADSTHEGGVPPSSLTNKGYEEVAPSSRAAALVQTLSAWFNSHDAAGFVMAGFVATPEAVADSSHPAGLSLRDPDWDTMRGVVTVWGDDLQP
jgi:hypothetical protein